MTDHWGMPTAETTALRSFAASRVTLARRRSNVTYLPTFSAQWHAELVRLSDTGKLHGPVTAPRPIDDFRKCARRMVATIASFGEDPATVKRAATAGLTAGFPMVSRCDITDAVRDAMLDVPYPACNEHEQVATVLDIVRSTGKSAHPTPFGPTTSVGEATMLAAIKLGLNPVALQGLVDAYTGRVHGPVVREVVSVGWDGRSQPMLRYRDELHLPDSLRSIVTRDGLAEGGR